MQFYLHPVTNVRSTYKASIQGAFNLITSPLRYKDITEQLRAIEDEKERKAFKKNHFDSLCVSGLFSRKADDCLLEHSGLMGIDIDHIGKEYVEEVKQEFIHDPTLSRDFELEMAFRSPSGDGLKMFVQIDLQQASHEEWYQAIGAYILMNYGIKIDANCKNVSRGGFNGTVGTVVGGSWKGMAYMRGKAQSIKNRLRGDSPWMNNLS